MTIQVEYCSYSTCSNYPYPYGFKLSKWDSAAIEKHFILLKLNVLRQTEQCHKIKAFFGWSKVAFRVFCIFYAKNQYISGKGWEGFWLFAFGLWLFAFGLWLAGAWVMER